MNKLINKPRRDLTTDDLRFFSQVAGSSTMAAAARAMDITPPAVTQRLQALENKLGFRLLERSGRKLILTAEGQIVMSKGRSVLEQLEEVEEDLARRRSSVAGHLRVIAPLGFGRSYVAQILARFQLDYPDTPISLMMSARPAQLMGDGWDIIINVGKLRETSLVARRLAPNNRVVCCSPDYIRRHGAPQHPEELAAHRCVALRENDEDVTLWEFASESNPRQRAKVRVHPMQESNEGEVVRQWGVAGLGIILRSEWAVMDDIRSGKLVRLLPDWQPASADIYALFASGRKRAVRTQRFAEAMVAALSPPPWRA